MGVELKADASLHVPLVSKKKIITHTYIGGSIATSSSSKNSKHNQ